jgi:hypothetical protein
MEGVMKRRTWLERFTGALLVSTMLSGMTALVVFFIVEMARRIFG